MINIIAIIEIITGKVIIFAVCNLVTLLFGYCDYTMIVF